MPSGDQVMKRRDLSELDEAALGEWLRERKAREYDDLRRVVEEGSPEERRALARRNHAGAGHVRWVPGRKHRR